MDTEFGGTEATILTDEELLFSEIHYKTIVFAWPVFILIGLIGNVLVAIHMTSLSRDVYAHCVYFAFIAAFDTFALLREANIWLEHVNGYDVVTVITDVSSVTCKLISFVVASAQHMQVWLFVCLSVECCVAARRRDVNNRKMVSCSRAVVLLLLVVVACVDCHYFWTYDRIDLNSHDVQGILPTCMPVSEREVTTLSLFEGLISTGLLVHVLPYTTITIVIVVTTLNLLQAPASHESAAWQRRYLLFYKDIRQVRYCVFVLEVLYLLTHALLIGTLLSASACQMLQCEPASLAHHVIDFLGKFGKLLFLCVKFFVCFLTCDKFRARVVAMFSTRQQ